MKLLVIISLLFCSFLTIGQDLKYSFFVAGHAYGSVDDPADPGMHPPFVDYFDEINAYPGMSFGVLTGDVVNFPTADYWDAYEAQILGLDDTVYLAAGNHDVGSEFENRFGNYYYDFKIDSQLFIVLTPSVNWMSVVGEQYNFLDSTLNAHQNDVDRIFIFMHELLWWSSTNEYANVEVNFPSYYPATPTNWEDVLKPRFIACGVPVTVYAGDIGCRPGVSSYMYDTFDNITLIASGLGSYVRDNIIITEVYEDSVYFNMVAINYDYPGALGSIYDFDLDHGIQFSEEVHVYPNPSNDYLVLSNNDDHMVLFTLTDMNGNFIQEYEVPSSIKIKISTANLRSGVYFLTADMNSGKVFERIFVK